MLVKLFFHFTIPPMIFVTRIEYIFTFQFSLLVELKHWMSWCYYIFMYTSILWLTFICTDSFACIYFLFFVKLFSVYQNIYCTMFNYHFKLLALTKIGCIFVFPSFYSVSSIERNIIMLKNYVYEVFFCYSKIYIYM